MLPADDVTSSLHRLPDGLLLGVVHLQVADLARSLQYYERVIGLTALSMDASEATLGVATGSVPLVVLHQQPEARPAGRHARLGLYHYAILLPDRFPWDDFSPILPALGSPAAQPITPSARPSTSGIRMAWASRSTPIDLARSGRGGPARST